MAVLVDGQEVVLLVPIRAMCVANESQEFEDIQRPVDGRRRRHRVGFPAATQDFDPAQVSLAPGEDVDQRASLRGPSQAARAQEVAYALPGA